MEHEIPFGNSNGENGPTFLDLPLFLGIFQWEEPTKRVPFTAEPEIPQILTKINGKRPVLSPDLSIRRSFLGSVPQVSLTNAPRKNDSMNGNTAGTCWLSVSN